MFEEDVKSLPVGRTVGGLSSSTSQQAIAVTTDACVDSLDTQF